MSTASIPRLLEPEQLQALLGEPELLVVHLSNTENYSAGHIEGAVYLEPISLLSGEEPAIGRLPDADRLSRIFSALGLTPDKHVVACDNDGGGWAGRLIWTLDVLGHEHWSYLNGGILAWQQAGLPTVTKATIAERSDYEAVIHTEPIAEIEDILPRLKQPDFTVWDARSREEYEGQKTVGRSGRLGHIPGAVHLEWLDLMQHDNAKRLLPEKEMRERLASLGIDDKHDIVTHCYAHHRSSLTYLAGRLLGLNIRGYHGSWSEWGNRDDTPVET